MMLHAVAAKGGGWGAPEYGALASYFILVVAVAAAAVAFSQFKEAKRLRREQAQPSVVALMRHTVSSPFIIDIVFRNFGLTPAYDVRPSIDPVVRRSTDEGSSEAVWIPEVIPFLAPGQEWSTMWDFSRARQETDLPTRHDVEVAFKDSANREYSTKSVLDWSAYTGRRFLTQHTIHDAAKSLKEISKTLSSFREGIGPHAGVRVFVRDGAEKDRRDTERNAERQAAHQNLTERLLPKRESENGDG